MRDLEADLATCNAATPGPWERNEKPSFGDWWVYVGGQHICLLPADKKGTHFGEMFKANAEFIAAAREGWPHAIERAIKAEAKLDRLIEGCMRCAGEDDAEVERLRLMVESITGGLDEAIETNHYLEKQLETAIEDIEILCTRHYELADDYDKLADVCQDFCLHIEGKCFKAATDNPNRCVNFKWRG